MYGTQMTFEGNLAYEPELRYTPAGTAVVEITVMVNTGRKDKASGEWVADEPTSWRVNCWDTLGQHVAESLRKGDRVIVVGHLRTEAYADRETGEKRRAQRVTADTVGISLLKHPAHSERDVLRVPVMDVTSEGVVER